MFPGGPIAPRINKSHASTKEGYDRVKVLTKGSVRPVSRACPQLACQAYVVPQISRYLHLVPLVHLNESETLCIP